MRDWRNLSGLPFPAIERAAKQIRRAAANAIHRIPEIGRARLVGHILHLTDDPTVPDPEKLLAGKLKIVPLHVYGPALVADDIDAFVYAANQIIERDVFW